LILQPYSLQAETFKCPWMLV